MTKPGVTTLSLAASVARPRRSPPPRVAEVRAEAKVEALASYAARKAIERSTVTRAVAAARAAASEISR